MRADNRASDLNGFYPGLGLHDRIGTPNLRAAGVAQCDGGRCQPPLPAAIVAFVRPGPGRILVIADSFGDEMAGDFSRICRPGLARADECGPVTPPACLPTLRGFQPDAVIVAYHDAGALA